MMPESGKTRFCRTLNWRWLGRGKLRHKLNLFCSFWFNVPIAVLDYQLCLSSPFFDKSWFIVPTVLVISVLSSPTFPNHFSFIVEFPYQSFIVNSLTFIVVNLIRYPFFQTSCRTEWLLQSFLILNLLFGLFFFGTIIISAQSYFWHTVIVGLHYSHEGEQISGETVPS
jgi:hypothetical protein